MIMTGVQNYGNRPQGGILCPPAHRQAKTTTPGRRQPAAAGGFSSIMAVMFVTIFAVLAISFTAMSNINVQMSANQRDISKAQSAAESGLQFAMYLIHNYTPDPSTYSATNTVTAEQAEATFNDFTNTVATIMTGATQLSVSGSAWVDGVFRVPASGGMDIGNNQDKFALEFTFVPGQGGQAHTMLVTSIGISDNIQRRVQLAFPIIKDNRVLEYAIAGRGRMWITGDSTIEGDIYSTWDRADISPFNMTADSSVIGTINTILSLDTIKQQNYQLETLDENDQPMFDENGDRIYSPEDEIQGYHEGINYGVECPDMPGLDIADYDTSSYRSMVSPLPPSGTIQTEYFPHAPGDYTSPKPGYSSWVINYYHMQMNRQVYQNTTLENILIPAGSNALFENCTFNGIIFIECGENGDSYNNIRFDNCTFNGPIITDVPQPFNWIRNCLYFTGSANFQNTTMEEATILAPNFNVNLGNTDPAVVQEEGSHLTGAVVGGIVDVRGNATIDGTIISMYDTTGHSSGYVTNIGATLGDGGSETTDAGDVGTINITPDPHRLLPSGIKTPIIISDADQNSYVELN